MNIRSATTLVRPSIRRAAIVVTIALVPIALHGLWDYIEIRRLVAEIERLRDAGVPLTIADAAERRSPATPTGGGAGRYYRAAAILASDSGAPAALRPIASWFAEPAPARDALPTVLAGLDAVVTRQADALALADAAQSRPIEPAPAEADDPYQPARLIELGMVIDARTLALSAAGRSDAAVDSALSRLQLRRALASVRWPAVAAETVGPLLSLAPPSSEALLRLQAAFVRNERPSALPDGVTRERARFIDLLWRRHYGSNPNMPENPRLPQHGVVATIIRPFVTHAFINRLRDWSAMQAVVSLPPAERTARLAAIRTEAERPATPDRLSFFEPLLNPRLPGTLTLLIATIDPLTLDRCAITALAIERYRRDHADALPPSLDSLVPAYLATVPRDPYAGAPLRYNRQPVGYRVYSVGANGRDDGGNYEQRQAPGRRSAPAPDIGVRVFR